MYTMLIVNSLQCFEGGENLRTPDQAAQEDDSGRVNRNMFLKYSLFFLIFKDFVNSNLKGNTENFYIVL